MDGSCYDIDAYSTHWYGVGMQEDCRGEGCGEDRLVDVFATGGISSRPVVHPWHVCSLMVF